MKQRTKYFLVLFFWAYLLSSCEFSKVHKEFIDAFDLELTGRVVDVKYNGYGHKLVCLEVLSSNHKAFFPIYNPNKYLDANSQDWEQRFFIKVKNDTAIFIFEDMSRHRHITDHIVVGAIVKINEENSKTFRVYDNTNRIFHGGLMIRTLPIRNHIESSCLHEPNF